MAGYLSESDFVMVEEGFSTRDLLEELTLGASQATTAEMELVQHIGVPASKIICANPCKQIAQIKYAAKHGVRLLSFDNEVELAKVVKSHPSAKMVLCIATQASHSLSHLSLRFGASLRSCRHLLENAKKSHVEVVGVSFHIGSGCPDPQAYAQSIADARLVFQMGAELGHTMNILDLGGGFPGLEGAKVRFEEIASVINSALDLYFPEGCGVDILAKLGRYYVSSAFTVAVNIVAKKEVLPEQPSREEGRPQAGSVTSSVQGRGIDNGQDWISSPARDDSELLCPHHQHQCPPLPFQIDQASRQDLSGTMSDKYETSSAPKTIVYHLDEGVYGIFNSVLFDNTCPTPTLQKKPSADQPLYSSSLWGPAVDGCDRVAEGLWLPKLHIGDWLVFDNMGAYTMDTKSVLGGTQDYRITYAMSRLAWEALRGQLLPGEDQDAEDVCKPLSCGWEITDTLCVGPVFTPASIM
uniref:antizyme inhibitor 2 isoform X2 n=1 Tax=Myodes glareolus TaxID=447135 RepID=UPI0020208EF8|nr:antizyme inhibitor 2 isoform X2 [Myodes glareolus]